MDFVIRNTVNSPHQTKYLDTGLLTLVVLLIKMVDSEKMSNVEYPRPRVFF